MRLLIVGGVVTACADLVSPSSAVTVILPAAADLLVMIRTLDDLTSRVGPNLGGGVADELRSSLDAMNTALKAADAPAADQALTRAKNALAAYEASSQSPPEEAPDASVVELELIYVEASLKRPCESFPGSGGASIVQPGTNTNVSYSCR